MPRTIRTIILTILSILMVTPAFAQTPVASPVTTTSPTYDESACMYDLPKGITEGEDAICGWVTAPMYADGSGAVRIPVIRMLATTDTPAAEPLVILLGGPGQDMSAALPMFGTEIGGWNALLERQDVILFDQRGMGKSEPSLSCPIEQKMRDGAVESDMAIGFGFIQCGNQLIAQGIDPRAFTTQMNAGDVEAIRVAMGYDQLDLYGISYGSKLALSVLRDYPDSIRATIISSPLPLESNVFADQTTGFDTALKHLWDACAADPGCHAANPDPAGDFVKAVARLKASPVTITATNPSTNQQMDIAIDDVQLLQIMYLGVFVGPLAPALPFLVTELANGDDALLQAIAPSLMVSGGLSMGALFTYFCQDEVPFDTKSETQTVLGEADLAEPIRGQSWIGLDDQLYAVCGAWKYPPGDPIENEPVVSDEPLLILTGTFDPITPATNGDKVLANFANGQVVNFAAQGHDPASFDPECSDPILEAFLNDPMAPVDASCAATPIDFSPPDWYTKPGATPIATPAVTN